MDTNPLADNGAIVTGASAGIGRETARVLAADGADVTLVARREDRLEELANEIESETDTTALVCPADVSDEAEVQAVVEETVSTVGRLDILVNNAGIATDSETPVEEFPTDQYRTEMRSHEYFMSSSSSFAVPRRMFGINSSRRSPRTRWVGPETLNAPKTPPSGHSIGTPIARRPGIVS